MRLFDGLITQLGRPELASGNTPILVPDTELSLFVNANRYTVAIMIESPEPLPWQRIWRGTTLTLPNAHPTPLLPIWSVDGTRGLFIIATPARGTATLAMNFLGNIGAEAPCIMLLGKPVTEPVTLAQCLWDQR